ncbi:Zn-dependent hydrolase [Desulfovibrio sp. OttesenSCG-928-G15]|nr:Zn-dependent hydrolase [Desulfovibrio sp. OttesenSCG-928-G15]
MSAMPRCNEKRLEEKITAFSRFGATGQGGITRLALSEADVAARNEFCARCRKLGLSITMDDMGNIYATLQGSGDGPAIYSGSHIDSVKQGGNYDGVLGVLAALEAAESIVERGIPLRHSYTIVIWTNEEGARFPPAIMSSGVITGRFQREEAIRTTDSEGVTFEQALAASGYLGEAANRLDPDDCLALVELHIEQGPVLEAEKTDIGVVAGVVGMLNHTFRLVGQAGHAGTTPMKYRRDALFAACKVIELLHEQLDRLDGELVYTTGQMKVEPNIHTIIPAMAAFSLDARHRNPEVIAQVKEVIAALPKTLVGCELSVSSNWERDTTVFDPRLTAVIRGACERLAYSHKEMYSGPGHDAQYMATAVPTAMIFVPSEGGHSHTEIEHTSLAACAKGVDVLLNTILTLDQQGL